MSVRSGFNRLNFLAEFSFFTVILCIVVLGMQMRGHNMERKTFTRKPMTLRLRLIFLLPGLLPGLIASAQTIGYRSFRNVIAGGGATTVSAFAQDSLGMMWFGTNKGLVSYDGYVTRAHHGQNDSTNTYVYSIEVLDERLLCLGTEHGVLFYDYQSDTYQSNTTRFPSDVRALLRDGQDLWIGSLKGLYRYRLDSRQLESFAGEGAPTPNKLTVYALAKLEGDLYIGTYNGLYRKPDNDRSVGAVSLATGHRRTNFFVNSLWVDRHTSILWVGTEGALYRYDPATVSAGEVGELRNQSVKSLAMDKYGMLLAGTDAGVYLYDTARQVATVVVHDARNDRSLANNIVWAIFSDRQGNWWFGTDYGTSVTGGRPVFQTIPIYQITGVGEGNRFYNILRDGRGRYWLGGTNGLIRTDSLGASLPGQVWYRMGDPHHPLSHNRIRDIYEDIDRQIWIATDGSVNRYNERTQGFDRFAIVNPERTANANWAYDIFEDRHRQLWIATYLGGIFVVDKQRLMAAQGEYVADHQLTAAHGLAGDFVNQLLQDMKGDVWALVYKKGLHRIQPDGYRVSNVTDGNGQPIALPTYMLQDAEGIIWVGGDNAVYRMDPQHGTCKIIPISAFGAGEILCMAQVGGAIWISTGDALWTLDRNTFELKRIKGESDFTAAFYDERSRQVLLGAVNNITVLPGDAPHAETGSATLSFTALLANDLPVDMPGSSIRYRNRIDLPHDRNSLVFRFSDFGYAPDESKQFVYKLEGVDADWILLDRASNQLTYTNLQPGTYQLGIRKLDLSGNPTGTPLRFTVLIRPPWYNTVLAKALYTALAIGLLLWVINFFRVRHNLKIERIEKQKTLELTNLKINFFTDVSHEFKTPLSLILGPASQLLMDAKHKGIHPQLEGIQRNALQLNTLIQQVLEFNRLEGAGDQVLMRSDVEWVSLVKSTFAAFEESASALGRTYVLQTDLESLAGAADVIKVRSILDNVLANAFKYTREGDRITVSLAVQDGNVVITVSDTGIGIPEKDLPYVFDRFYRAGNTANRQSGSGIGLYLAKHYAGQHGGSMAMEAIEGKGATIRIALPIAADGPLPADTLHKANSAAVSGERYRILVVDDNREITDFLFQLLDPHYTVRVAHDGKEGLQLCMEWLPDVVVADAMMPVMDGLDMSRQIRNQVPLADVAIILLTAKDDKQTELDSMDKGIDVFMAKPFDVAILRSRIAQLIEKKEAAARKQRVGAIATPQVPNAISPDERFLAEVTRVIEDRIDDPELNVQALSDRLDTGTKQLYRKVKQLTGLTPVEYIRSIRMKKAAMLLGQRKFTVAEVMYMVGFSNPSYFSKCFHTVFGRTPREFASEEGT